MYCQYLGFCVSRIRSNEEKKGRVRREARVRRETTSLSQVIQILVSAEN